MSEQARPASIVPSVHDLTALEANRLVDLSVPLFAWDRISSATLALAAAFAFWLLLTVLAFCTRVRRYVFGPARRSSEPVRVMQGSAAMDAAPPPAAAELVDEVISNVFKSRAGSRLTARFMNTLLACPGFLVVVALAAVLAPTSLQLITTVQDVIAGKDIFAIDIASLRSVTGVLTDRQDAYSMWNDVGAPTMLTILASPPPPITPPPWPPLAPVPGATRRLQGEPSATRRLDLLYTRKGGRRYDPSRVLGNVLTVEALTHIRDIERKVLEDVDPHMLHSWKSAVPCFFSNTSSHGDRNLVREGEHPLSAMPEGVATEGSVEACLRRIVQSPSYMYRIFFGTDFESSFVGSQASCSALRSEIEIDASADFDALIERLSALSDGAIELTFGGDAWLSFRELYLTLQGDLVYIFVSIGAILLFLIAVLNMPLFASFALLVILLCFPVTIALYLGAFNQEQLPVLSVVSLYLVLGIGADNVFIFTNTSALRAQL